MGTYPISSMNSVMQGHATAVHKNAEQALKDIANAGVGIIIDGTPVDTTKAVANWKLTSGSPFAGIVGERVPGSKKGSGAGAARASMKSEAAGRIEAHKGEGPIYFANNAPYIRVLEYGDSKHRPSGMVAKGLQAMRLRASSIRILSTKV